jgi:hypothetical protein
MALVLSPAFVLQSTTGGAFDLSRPIIGWENQIKVAGVDADSEDPENPAIHTANPSTNLFWRAGNTAEQYLTYSLNEELPTDYVGIARHNLGSAGVVVSVEVRPFADAEWVELVEGFVAPDDAPLLIRYNEIAAVAIRLKMVPLERPPEIAVVHIGRLLSMPIAPGIGYTPLIDGRITRTATGTAEAGDYLGSIILSQRLESSVSFQNLDDEWYRQYLRPFVKQGRGSTFFFSGFPDSHPREAGYAWLTADPRPDFIEGLRVNLTLDMGGIVT